ncbi:HigA family addiction module antitoxin [Nesterenkonia ebinurensis]|uniref:HigA family addiction module antitoxin n=1 Tax=Nesterenkonia ebinurensis TaxID=2608252 RepID=UPI001CC440CB|nr:HigA family addiction module antitoxin [Nesterenkonia ebinurensis]
MEMFEAVHPGKILREEIVNELGLSVSEAAERLGVTRAALSRVLNCRAAVSASLARRLETSGLSTAQQWLRIQLAYDLAQERNKELPQVKSLLES